MSSPEITDERLERIEHRHDDPEVLSLVQAFRALRDARLERAVAGIRRELEAALRGLQVEQMNLRDFARWAIPHLEACPSEDFIQDVKRALVTEALIRKSKIEAAKLLGVNRNSLRSWLKEGRKQ